MRVEALAAHHDRARFSCGVEPLDRYFHHQVTQDVRRRVAACFVLVGEDEATPLGFYTLAATAIALEDLPAPLARRLPRYPLPPATLLGRLAVDGQHRGHGHGELLLMDAFGRTLRSEIASFAFVVDAKDEAAAGFYGRFGFLSLTQRGPRMFLPITEIAKLLA